MRSDEIFVRLQQLPLFMGLSHAEMLSLIERVPLDFASVEPGSHIVAQEQHCTHAVFIISGECTATVSAPDCSYSIQERVEAPLMFQPECVYGMQQRFSRSFAAFSSVQTLQIERQYVAWILRHFEWARVNMMGMLSNATQRAERNILTSPPTSISEKLMKFVNDRTLFSHSPVTLHIKMTTLAKFIGESRLNLSRTLHSLQQQGVLTMTRGVISLHKRQM